MYIKENLKLTEIVKKLETFEAKEMSEKLMPKWNKEIGIIKMGMTSKVQYVFYWSSRNRDKRGEYFNGYSWKIFRTVNTNPHIQQA